jgi:hypothetical protein
VVGRTGAVKMVGAGTLAVGEFDAPGPLNAASAATAIAIKLTTRTPLISSDRRAAGRTTPGHGRVADTFDAAIELRTLSIPLSQPGAWTGGGEIHPQRSAVKR